jgi:uncharacterized OB-fold protein
MSDKVQLKTTAARITPIDDVWILHMPRFGEEGTHLHTYGILTPYFKGLQEGRLLATRCTYSGCPIGKGDGEMWLPPRADCPDCHQPMEWQEIVDPTGYIYAYTYVERGGTGLEIECPYYQIDVKIEGVCTMIKSYLLDRTPIQIGDRVKAGFRTGAEATNTCLDLYWELI